MSAQDELTVVLASDARGVFPASVAIWSIVETAAPTTTYHICYLVDGVSEEQKEDMRKLVARADARHRISFIDVSDYIEEGKLPSNSLPKAAWARIFTPYALPEVHKALYVDIDTVICTDLKPLFDTPLEGKAAGVVLERFCSPNAWFNKDLGMPLDCQGYFNSGVILMNLDFFRQEKLVEKIVAFSAAHPEGLPQLDQDALNCVLYPHIVCLHTRWNWNDGFIRRILKCPSWAEYWTVFKPKECIEAALHPGIMHYRGPGRKPWHYNHRPGRKVWEDFALRSGVLKEIRLPRWSLSICIKRILYAPLYALAWLKIHRLAKRWGIK